MVTFNHNESNTLEAVGLTSEKASELFVQTLEEYRKSREYIPMAEQRIAILVAVTKVVDPQMLSVILESVGSPEFNTASELIEYLYHTLKDTVYYSLTALCIKNMGD